MEELKRQYVAWNSENIDFYMELKEHDSPLYERFMPVYEVLRHIYTQLNEETLEPSDDLERIFTVGLEFLHDQFASCKLYLNTNFSGDIERFIVYDDVISMILYIEDLRYEFKEKKVDVDDAPLRDLLDELETIIVDKKEVPDNLRLYVDDRVKDVLEDVDFHFCGIIDIFVQVAEALGIYLYEKNDIKIGKDIEHHE